MRKYLVIGICCVLASLFFTLLAILPGYKHKCLQKQKINPLPYWIQPTLKNGALISSIISIVSLYLFPDSLFHTGVLICAICVAFSLLCNLIEYFIAQGNKLLSKFWFYAITVAILKLLGVGEGILIFLPFVNCIYEILKTIYDSQSN